MTAQMIDGLHWQRVGVELRNTHNTLAREHPLFVLRAILKHARRCGEVPEDCTVVFRVQDPPGARVRKERLYRVQLLFPGNGTDIPNRMMRGLCTWLAHPSNHFAIERISGPEERSLQILREENPLEAALDEICLDFHTPLAFTPEEKARPWALGPGRLAAMLGRRVAAAGGAELAPPEADVRVMPWYFGDLERHEHRKEDGVCEFLSGFTGPLYLRGDWMAWEPWLLLATEWLLGAGTTRGQGAFRLIQQRPCIDRLLPDRGTYRRVWEEYVHNTDRGDPFTHAYQDPEVLAAGLAETLAGGSYQPEPARGVDIAKPAGGHRRIHVLEPPDAIAQRALHELLSPRFDRIMQDASIGFRPGLSVQSARERVGSAIRDGCDHVVESDIRSFFDEIPWQGMDDALDAVLPRADMQTRGALDRIIRQQTTGQSTRDCGLLQGGPLSPLLANVFLTPLDEGMAAAGFEHFIRYGDDFVVLTEGEDEAHRALETVTELCRALGLALHENKTSIRPVSLGFRFLGLKLGGPHSDEVLEQAALRRHVILRAPWGFAGVDHDSLIVRRKGADHVRVPFARIGQLAIQGPFGISTALLNACSSRGIPVSFCTAAGHHLNTLLPNRRRSYLASSLHERAWQELGPDGRLRTAVSLIAAKLCQQSDWLAGLPAPMAKAAAADIRSILARLPSVSVTEELLGLEGSAARMAFPAVNALVLDEAFRSERREPRRKADRWNALLDFGYSQMFSQINVLIRGEGLNPYLGFLHSPAARFESLAADLQEPFRPRIDRWAVRCVNLGTIRPEHFQWQGEQTGWHLTQEAFPIALEHFARELDRRIGRDPGTLLQLLRGQVLTLLGWAEGNSSLRFEPPRPNEKNTSPTQKHA